MPGGRWLNQHQRDGAGGGGGSHRPEPGGLWDWQWPPMIGGAMGDPAVPGVAQHPIPDRLLWDQLWPSIPEVPLWDCCRVQLRHIKAPPQSSYLNTSTAHGLDAASWDAPAPGCLSIRPAVPRQPSSLPGCHRFPGVGNGRGGPCSVADYSRFPARSPSPLSASCLRLLPGFTRAISKRSLEIDFYHLVINIV